VNGTDFISAALWSYSKDSIGLKDYDLEEEFNFF
jgi:hypothetical protein